MRVTNIRDCIAAVLSVLFFVAQDSATTCITNKRFDVPQVCGTVSYETQPISDVTVELLNAQNVLVSQATTAADGQYLLKQVSDGKYVLSVKVNGFAQAWQPIALKHSRAADGSCKRPIIVRLEAAGKCSVVVPPNCCRK
jgi:hypothetical protein